MIMMSRDDLFIESSIKILAAKCIKEAILNIKNRRIEKNKNIKNYDLCNWVEDWYWLTDDESDFPLYCQAAGYKDPESLINDILRLTKTRIKDGIKESYEWLIAEEGLYE